MESNLQEDKLEGWTKEEKFELLEALKEFGSFNIDNIREFVSNKTGDQIRDAIEFYKRKASVEPPVIQKRERKINLPTVPLSSWAKFIIDTHGFDDLQTETAAALRLIAEFEEKPPAVCTEKIDFKKVYHMLADALEGKPLPNDKYVLTLFDKCIVETALTSKALNRGTKCFKRILQTSCNPEEADVNSFIKPTEDKELITLRYLATKRNYNPLNIPESSLKFPTFTVK
ncbi:uncharacterized protein LOC120625939 [Pararge aegeria]|uniref:Jg9466 protein n=2 Tax=Pararge aegeria TaxID=116150 RepID=A0A8S4RGZ2_9NEOP|nr:uncharacterized protein LOC120625939 [Pararge aegeria]CAH2236973.1 jg9466 [Pararge aegeria aegeria]